MDKKAFVGYDDSDTEPESSEEDEYEEDIAQSQKSWSSTNSKNSDGDYSYHTANGLDFLEESANNGDYTDKTISFNIYSAMMPPC
jgi:hypothetical protein